MAYEAAIAAIPALFQTGVGIAQTAKGRGLARGLKDPIYTIPQSERDALALARNQAGKFAPPGSDAYMNTLGQIMAGAENQINRSATSANEALGATLAASGQQMKALNDYQGFAEGNYQDRQQRLMGALDRMAGYEDAKWQNDINQAFLRKAQAAQSLVGAGIQNTNAGIGDISGVVAGSLKAKADRKYEEEQQAKKDALWREIFGTKTETGMIPATATENTGMMKASPSALEGWDEWVNKAFGQYGDAYSSQEEPIDYTPKSTQSEFYTP